MQNLYAKIGSNIESGQYFIFTGERGRIPGGWEVDHPTYDGIFPHGVAVSPITDGTLTDDALLTVNGPVVLQLSGSVLKGELLSCDSFGKAKKKIVSEALAGIALKNGVTNSYVEAMLFSAFWPSSASSVITTSGPTYASNTWIMIPEMSGTINVRAQSRIIVFASTTIELAANDDIDFIFYLTPVGGMESAILSSQRNIKMNMLGTTIRQNVCLQEMILNLNPGQYTVDLRWRANSGIAKAIGTQRALHITGA